MNVRFSLINIKYNIFVVFFFFLFFNSLSVTAQEYKSIKGIIRDKISNKPVMAASVYVNNTTFGVISAEDGSFSLKVYTEFPLELVISSIAYQTSVLKITEENYLENFNIELEPQKAALREITIQLLQEDGWKLYGELFTEELIGYSSFASQCKLLNKENVQLYYDQETGILHATADKPLHILNHATGYEITYWLEDFELHIQNKKLYHMGYAYFKELSTTKRRKLNKWLINREAAYNGSLYHFLKSLYDGKIKEEGFEIRRLERVQEEEAQQYIPLRSDTFNFGDTDRLKELFTEILPESELLNVILNFKSWKEDSLNTTSFRINLQSDFSERIMNKRYASFGKNLDKQTLWMNFYDVEKRTSLNQDIIVLKQGSSKRDTDQIKIEGMDTKNLPGLRSINKKIDLLHPEVLNPDSLVKRMDFQNIKLQFSGYLQITYLKEKEERNFIIRQFPFFQGTPGFQISVISIKNPLGISILQDGNFYNSYDLMVEQYWSYEKLDKLMPLNYKPLKK